VAKRSPFHWWSTALKTARRVQNRRDVQTNTPKLDIYIREQISLKWSYIVPKCIFPHINCPWL
jgi:hypothetical protein